MKITHNKIVLIFLIIASLTGCGGGGISDSAGLVSSTLTFPLQSGLAKSVTSGSTTYFTISGSCSGTASMVDVLPVAAAFEGKAVQSASTTIRVEYTDCIPLISSSTTTNYYDSNLMPLGSISGSEYGIFVTPPTIPVGVKVGDKGTIGAQILYADITKAVQIGQEVISFAVEPDSENSAIINIIIKSYDSNGVLTFTEQDRYRIIADGTLSPISSDLQGSNGSTIHLLLIVVAPPATPVSGSWGAPELVSNDLFDATTANKYQFAGDNFGNMFLVTSYWALDFTHVAATAYQKQAVLEWGAQFNLSPVKTVPAPGVSNFKDTQVQFDGAGNAVASWVDFDISDPSDRNFTSHVYVRNYDKVNGWNTPIMIQSNPAEYANAVNLTVQDDGSAWIVWTERTYKDATYGAWDKYALFVAKYTPSSGWGVPEKVTGDYNSSQTSGSGSNLYGLLWGRIAIDNASDPTVIWTDGDYWNPGSTLYSSSRVAGIWSASSPVVGYVGASGDLNAITSFDIPSAMLNGIPGPGAIAKDKFGNAFLVWSGFDGYMISIWAARFDSVLGWQAPVTISESSPNAQSPQIEFDSLGNAVIIWNQIEPLLYRGVIKARRYDHNAGWGVIKNISNGNGAVMDAQLAVFDDGNATAVWPQDDIGNSSYKMWSNDFIP